MNGSSSYHSYASWVPPGSRPAALRGLNLQPLFHPQAPLVIYLISTCWAHTICQVLYQTLGTHWWAKPDLLSSLLELKVYTSEGLQRNRTNRRYIYIIYIHICIYIHTHTYTCVCIYKCERFVISIHNNYGRAIMEADKSQDLQRGCRRADEVVLVQRPADAWSRKSWWSSSSAKAGKKWCPSSKESGRRIPSCWEEGQPFVLFGPSTD